jgi:pyruvate carboxylase
VTEAITGHDLVEWQFRVASGEALPVDQAGLAIHGHAVGIDPDALARRQGERPQGARRGQEAVIRVLGVEPRLDGSRSSIR